MAFDIASIVDFYKTRANNGDPKPFSTLATKVKKYCYTRPDEDDIEDIYNIAGASGKKRLIYFNGAGIWDPEDQASSPKNTPQICPSGGNLRRNNVGWFSCTPISGFSTSPNGKPFVVNIRDDIFAANSHNWFMRSASTGQPIKSGTTFPGNVYLDMGNSAVRAKFKEVMNTWVWDDATENTTTPYDGFFFDNWDTRFDAQTPNPVSTLQYGAGDGEAFWNGQLQALDDFYAYAQSKTGHLGLPGEFIVNLQGHSRDAASLARFYQAYLKTDGSIRMTGGMIEFFGLSSSGGYKSTATFASDVQAVRHVTAFGSEVWNVIPVSNADIQAANSNINSTAGQRVLFGVVAHLLVTGPRVYLRVGREYGSYVHLNLLDDLTTDLGAPLGPYSFDGTTYTRLFERGNISLNPSTHAVAINITGGTANKPFVADPINRQTATGAQFVYQMVAQPKGVGAITYSMSSVAGLSINSSTGKITGSATVPGVYTVTQTYDEASGQTVTRTWELTVTGESNTPEIAVNCGGAAHDDDNGFTYEADPNNTTPHSSVAADVNGSTLAAIAEVPTPDASVPAELTDSAHMSAMGRSWRLDNVAPFFVYRAVVAPGTKTVRMGWNSSNDATGRLYDVYIGGVFKETINPALYPAHTVFFKTYTDIVVAGTELTIECHKNVSSTGSARLGMWQIIDQAVTPNIEAPEILTPVADTIEEIEESPAVPLTFSVTTNSPDGSIPIITAVGIPTSLDPALEFVDNEDGTADGIWSPGYEAEGTYSLIIQATHPLDPDLFDIRVLTIEVTKTNRPPELVIPSEVELTEGSVMLIELPGTDLDEEDTVTYSVTGNHAWSTIVDNGDGTYSWRLAPPNGTESVTPYDETITADDGIDQVDYDIEILVANFISTISGYFSYRKSRKRRKRRYDLSD